jgi:hypothetical protein
MSAIDSTAAAVINDADGTIGARRWLIYVAGGEIAGDLTNAGSMTVSTFDGIAARGGAHVKGSIANQSGGLIDVGDDGMEILGATIGTSTAAATGNLVNAGTIRTARSTGDAINVSCGARAYRGIENTATGVIESEDEGIQVLGAEIGNTADAASGNIVNAGRIEVASDGILVTETSTVRGDIRNSAGGLIDSATRGGDDAMADTATVGAAADTGIGIHNTGSLRGDGAAISVAGGAAVAGGITNSGNISGSLMLFGTDGSGGGIDVTNSGSIDLGTGTSHISGSFSQPGSALAIALLSFGDYAAPPLTILGDAAIAGELLLGFDPGFVFSPLARFTLIDIGGTRTGMFGNYGDDALVASFAGGDLYLDYLDGGDVELYTTKRDAVPAPAAWR